LSDPEYLIQSPQLFANRHRKTIIRVATSLGEKNSRTFQGHSSTFSRLISSDVLLRCGHIKSNRI